ncbi:hypothetical protein R70199_07594 [Paraburkholderia domus]|nr:hypothetical protein R70199_07594 [Paraburkholderia domus]
MAGVDAVAAVAIGSSSKPWWGQPARGPGCRFRQSRCTTSSTQISTDVERIQSVKAATIIVSIRRPNSPRRSEPRCASAFNKRNKCVNGGATRSSKSSIAATCTGMPITYKHRPDSVIYPMCIGQWAAHEASFACAAAQTFRRRLRSRTGRSNLIGEVLFTGQSRPHAAPVFKSPSRYSGRH